VVYDKDNSLLSESAMLSDKQLKDNVLQELEFDNAVDATNIGVTVEDGAVTLIGTINDYSQRFAAVNAVKRMIGVKALADNIDIVLSPKHRRDDSEIAKHIAHILANNVNIPEEGVKAIVHHGLVTLNGAVEYEKQRRTIKNQIAHVAGVNAINNRITIEPVVEPKDVKEQIVAALKRNVELECSHITVEVDGDKVILTGRVKAFYERELAQLAAWRASGVKHVVDKITVGN
jgi:osmotically-inducible protein OsmY